LSAEEVRSYGRFLTLETADRTLWARLNPVSLRCQQNLGEFSLQLSLSFEGIWLDTEFSTGTIPVSVAARDSRRELVALRMQRLLRLL